MFKHSARKTLGFLSLITLWTSVFAFYPASSYGQTPDDKKKAKSQNKKPGKAEAATAPAAAQTDGSKVLAPNEDPAQIGKRKINSGSDKLFGWLGGSQEKEMAVGRQLALQVEQQAKLVEDPIITEYVNLSLIHI